MSEDSADHGTLSEGEVRKLAHLSRLAPTDEQVEALRRDLGAVLRHARCLAEADLADVEPMARPVDEANRLDDDEPGETLDRATLERMAPSFEDGMLRVPKVIDGEGGA